MREMTNLVEAFTAGISAGPFLSGQTVEVCEGLTPKDLSTWSVYAKLMGELQTDTYVKEVPEHVDKSQEEWDGLSYHAQYYHANDRKGYQTQNKRKRAQEKKARVDEIKAERGCINCGEDTAVCLDFHHTDDDKNASISELVWDAASWERISDEIEKCVLTCANCHRKSHNGIIEIPTERFK